jgi:hypothetical protein
MRKCTIGVAREKQQLVVPGVGVERPGMAQDNGLACASVFVEGLSALRVLLPNRAISHTRFLSP